MHACIVLAIASIALLVYNNNSSYKFVDQTCINSITYMGRAVVHSITWV